MLKKQIEVKISRNFSPIYLKVEDESHLHIGHVGHKGGAESHFHVLVVSNSFCGLTRIQRHKLIYECLDEELKKGLHALRITSLCPEELEEQGKPK